jgi:uncharacterized protein YeaO (DUF488 family)
MANSLSTLGAARGPAPRLLQAARRQAVQLKRAHETPAAGDGMRILVDRLWPRGLSRERVAADLWLKDAAPSDALRRWFGHEPSRWAAFAARYRAELARRPEVLQTFDELRRRGPITLLYAARDRAINHAVVLRAVLDERRSATARTRPGVHR